MAAILRSGKFIRVVAGISRSLKPGASEHFGNFESTGGIPVVDGNVFHYRGSLGRSGDSIQNSLSYLGAVIHHQDEEENISIESKILSIADVEAALDDMNSSSKNPEDLSTEGAILLSLCGNTLLYESPCKRDELLEKIMKSLNQKRILNLSHFNVYLSIKLENEIPFSPEVISDDIRQRGFKPSTETYKFFLLRYCLDGNLEGANRVIRILRTSSLSDEFISNSLLLCHAQLGDMKTALSFLKSSSSSTYLTLCRGYAANGDVNGILRAIKEHNEISKESFSDKDYLEIIYRLSLYGHKDRLTEIMNFLSSQNPFNSHSNLIRLIHANQDDVALSLFKKYNQSPKSAKVFLKTLVKGNRPLTKLLWFASEMEKLNLLKKTEGMEFLLSAALEIENSELSLKLAQIVSKDRPSLVSSHISSLLSLAQKSNNESHFSAILKLIGDKLTPKDIMTIVLPKLKGSACELENILEKDFHIESTVVHSTLLAYLTNHRRNDEVKSFLLSHSSSAENQKYTTLLSDKESVGESSSSPPALQNSLSTPSNSNSTPTPSLLPLKQVLDLYISEGRIWDLENLYYSSGNCHPEDRKSIIMYTLQAYINHGLLDRAMILSQNVHYEGLDFPEFHSALSSLYSCSSPPFKVSSFRSKGKRDKVGGGGGGKDWDKNSLCSSLTECSANIETFVKENKMKEATELTERMLKRNTYPLPKIFRFLLNRLAICGDVESMEIIGAHLNSKVKKEVSFDNRLCNAYLVAGKGEVFLDNIQFELDKATPETLLAIQDKFPRGGAMGLLETEPRLIDKYTKLAEKYASYGYIAPINVLWTYYFIKGNHEMAKTLWAKYLSPSPQIMFQKICQTARSNSDVLMAERLIDLLIDAKVTPGAQGIAYSCLLDVLSSQNDFSGGLLRLKSGLEKGIKLTDVNRTALLRVKRGLENENKEFPFEIPKKTSYGMNEDRSLSPI